MLPQVFIRWRGIPWFLKNVDDLLLVGRNILELVKRIVYLLDVCLKGIFTLLTIFYHQMDADLLIFKVFLFFSNSKYTSRYQRITEKFQGPLRASMHSFLSIESCFSEHVLCHRSISAFTGTPVIQSPRCVTRALERSHALLSLSTHEVRRALERSNALDTGDALSYVQ